MFPGRRVEYLTGESVQESVTQNVLTQKKRKRILVADGDRSFREVTESILESAGYRVETAETAGSAFKEMRRNHYDLLILDSGLPGKMASKLCHTLKKSDRYSKLPILFMMGTKTFDQLEYEKQKIVEDGHACMHKPFKAKEFLANVHSLLEEQSDNEKSWPAEEAHSHRWMIWTSWRKQPAVFKGSGNSERRSQQ